MRKLLILLCFFLPISSLLTACGEKENEQTNNGSNGKSLTIYTTVYPLKYFAEQIGGNSVQVESIYPPGSDEHTFEPSQSDMMKLADSDLFIYIGLGLEGFVEKAKSTLESENVTLVPAGESIHFESGKISNEKKLSEDEVNHHHSDINPHVWLDPIYAKEISAVIKDALIKKMPEKKEEFTNNYEDLINKLDSLNNQFLQVTNEAKRNEFIVSHAAYGYWESRYGLKQISISGLSSSSEPSQQDLEKIVKLAKEKNIKYIFFEQNINSKLTEVIQSEIGAKPLYLHNLSVLTNRDIQDKRDYFSIMEDNIKSLQIALN